MAAPTLKSSTNERGFRVFLYTIAREITDDLLDSLKFLCNGDDLSEGEIDSAKTPRKFLELLWKVGKIWPGDVGYLSNLLETAGNIQLATWVKEIGEPQRKSSLPCQSEHFVGRDDVVDEIMKKFLSNTPRMILLIAPPGMGKSEVAIRVGHLLQKEGWGVVYVEKQKTMELCQEILFQLDRRHWTLNSSIVSHAKRKLSEQQEDVAMILDNTDDVQREREFHDFVEFLVRCAPKAHTIITTQHDIKSAVSPNIHKIRLDPFDRTSSAELLMNLAPISKCYAEEIGELCGGVPLFLVSCTCSMMADGFCPEVFTNELKQNPVRVLRDSEHLNPIYQGIGLFFSRLFPEHVLKNLVRLSVFPTSFSPNDIRFLFNDDYELQTVKTKMIQCCLLKRSNDGDQLTIHPLLKTYCRAERESLNLGAVGRAAEHDFNHHYLEILRRLHQQFIRKNSSSDAILSFRKEKANIMEAFENCLCDTSEIKEKAFAVDIANEVVDFLAKVLSPPKECTKLYQKCCEFARNSSDEKRLADSLNSSGFRCLDDAAHCEGNSATLACEMFQQAYDIRKGLPEEIQMCETHAHVTTKLGLCVLLQGDAIRGRELIREGITLRQVLGIELYIAAGNCDLGHSYRHCGDYKTALEVWRTETLPVYLEQLGDHPWTASILQHIASMYLELARQDPLEYADLAETYTRQALHLRVRLLGFHQDTARSHICLSDVFIIQGKLDQALDGLDMALEIQEDVLGVNQQDTVDTLNKITDLLKRLGRHHEAKERRRRSELLSQKFACK